MKSLFNKEHREQDAEHRELDKLAERVERQTSDPDERHDKYCEGAHKILNKK